MKWDRWMKLRESIRSELVNLTPHAINLNNGSEIPPSGMVARVSSKHSCFDEDGVCERTWGDVINLPKPIAGTFYIVSCLVLSAAKVSDPERVDLVAPATDHPDCRRTKLGHIVSVPGFVR